MPLFEFSEYLFKLKFNYQSLFFSETNKIEQIMRIGCIKLCYKTYSYFV